MKYHKSLSVVVMSLFITSLAAQYCANLSEIAAAIEAEREDEEISKIKAMSNVNVPIAGTHGSTALHEAARLGYCRAIALLIEKGACINQQNNRKETPLLWALDKAQAARLLIEKGADVQIADGDGNTPLHYAVSPDSISLLLEKGACINQKNKKGETPLLRKLRPLRYQPAAAMALIMAAADVHSADKNDYTPLCHAIKGKLYEVIDLLLQVGANVNQLSGFTTPLLEAVSSKVPRIVALLIEKGADIHMTDDYGNTPLHYAVRWGCEEIIPILLEKGAHINQKDNGNETPLQIAIKKKNFAIARLLIEKGADTSVLEPAILVQLTRS